MKTGVLIGLAALCAIAATTGGCDPCPSCPAPAPAPGAAHFVLTGSMTDSRIFHSGTLLDNGQVLVAGGLQIAGTLDAAEIYDPSAHSFTATAGAMTQARYHHTATLLSDGTVLIAGGDNGGGLLTATAFLSAELYDPANNKFKETGAMFAPRTWQTATRLADGKVLVAGGSPAVDSTLDPTTGTGTGLPNGALPNAELYDPTKKEFFGNPGPMNNARTEHTASLIKGCGCTLDNQVLLAGGIDASGTTLISAELFNESANSFTPTGSMNAARHNHTATTLNDGRVLIAGGVDNALNVLDSAEIFDPKTRAFTLTATPMTVGRAFHSAQLLGDGRVLLSGGSGDDSAEIFDPTTNRFTATTGPMRAVRFEQPSVGLPDGTVLVPGGALLLNPVGELVPGSSLDTAEVFSPGTGRFSLTAQTMVRSRVGHTATALNDGRILIAGGADLTRQIFDTSELYDPDAGAFNCIGGKTGRDCAPSLHDKRFSQTATSLKGSAEVLMAGGSDGTVLATAEVYNAASKTYACVGGVSSTPPICNDSMLDPRINHVAVALQSGEVLIAGGANSTGVLATAELYNPATGTFRPTGSMTTPREQFAGALFTSGPLAGQVLVTGGSDVVGHFVASAELYDPATGKFTATGSMPEARFLHTQTLLTRGPNAGDMLVAAGSGDQTAELYVPASGTFKSAGDMTQIVFDPNVATLANGQTLFAGGSTFNSQGQIVPISGAELYDPTTNRFSATDSMTTDRWLAASAFLDPAVVSGTESGNVLIAGGLGINSVLASSELFVPGMTSSSSTASAAIAAADLPPLVKQQEIAQTLDALRRQFDTGGSVGRR